MSTFRTAFVYVRNVFAGTLSETDEGYTFAYDGDYLKSEDASAVSLTLPLSDEPYSSKTLFSFFDGLIPEDWLLVILPGDKVSANINRIIFVIHYKSCIHRKILHLSV